MENEAWNKIHQVAWKFRTQNLVATYSHFEANLEHFLKSILGILYIVSKLGKSGVQHFKWCANQRWNEEVITIWRQPWKTERPFRNSTCEFKIQLMNLKWPQLRIHPLSLWCFTSSTLGIASRALHLP